VTAACNLVRPSLAITAGCRSGGWQAGRAQPGGDV